MDIIELCLSIAPVPYLSSAVSVFKFIWSTIVQVRASQCQLRALAKSIAQLLYAINNEYTAGRLVEARTLLSLEEFTNLLNEVKVFVRKQASSNFIRLILMREERISMIEGYHRRVSAAVDSFQVSALLNIQHWQIVNDNARVKDQQDLNERLSSLEANQNELVEALDAQHNNMMAMMVSITRRLDERQTRDQEYQFLSHSLQYLTTLSGGPTRAEDWVITSFEVDFGPEIGSGGFGKVYRGSWQKMEVALKVLRLDNGATPSPESITQEVVTWSKMRHPHILQFLGANILDDKPFIVMPYMQNGNARDYIRHHPDCNRLKILHHISLGLVYLHSQNFIHGDLKALNVLIDNSENALLCDFGLSRIKGNASSQTSIVRGSFGVGSRNWMAPEQLMGRSLKKPCDIYAFGMTIFEIYADEIPLCHINYMDFIELVVHQGVRPERPDAVDTPLLTDEIWNLAQKCWVKESNKRPNASSVCDSVARLLGVRVLQPSQTTDMVSQSDLPPHRHKPPVLQKPRNGIPHGPPSPQNHIGPTRAVPSLHARGVSEPNLRASSQVLFRSSSTQPLLSLREEPPLATAAPLQKQPKPEAVDWSKLSSTQVIRHKSKVQSVTFSLDGKWVISGSHHRLWSTKTFKIWELRTGKRVPDPFEGYLFGVVAVAISPGGKYVASCSWSTSKIHIREMKTGVCVIRKLTGHKQDVNCIAFSADGNLLASASQDENICIRNVNEWSYVLRPLGAGHNINSLAFSPDGEWLASGSRNKGIKLNHAKTEAVLSFSDRVSGGTQSVAFSPDGRLVASGSQDGSIRIWDARTGGCVARPLKGHSDGVTCIAFSPDGQSIVSGSRDATLRIWDVSTKRCVCGPLLGHTGQVKSVAFSPDGRSVVSGSYDKTIRIWSLN